MFIAHGPISYLVNEVIQKKRIRKLRVPEQILVAFISIFCGILPDFDLFVLLGTSLPDFIHHSIFSHTPIFFLGIWIVLRVLYLVFKKYFRGNVEKFLNDEFITIVLDTFLIGTLSHLVADSIFSGIMFLYPISTMKFSLLGSLLEPSYFGGFLLSPMFSVEIILCVVFGIVLYRKFFKKVLFVDIVGYISLFFSVLFFVLSIVLACFTYRSSYLYENGKENYDVDFDGMKDTVDSDVNNNGVDNLLDVNCDYLAKECKDIVDSKKIVISNPSDLVGMVKYRFGALDSYRVIAQSFFDVHCPIEPVLKSFFTSSLDSKGYNVDFNKEVVLYEYLKSKDVLIDINLEAQVLLPKGKIIFFMDSRENILNVGLTLDGNEIAIVMPSDVVSQAHTYSSIREVYASEVSRIQIQN